MLETKTQVGLDSFFQTLSVASNAALVVDYDRVIEPYWGIREWNASISAEDLFEVILNHCGTRVAVITERPASELLSILGKLPRPEIWGSSGLERLFPDGTYQLSPMDQDLVEAFAQADAWLEADGLHGLVTLMPAGMLVSWSGLDAAQGREARACAQRALGHFKGRSDVAIYEGTFSMEVRIRGGHVRRALQMMSEELPSDGVMAYLGCDACDPNVFGELHHRIQYVIVDEAADCTRSNICIRSTEELVQFLNSWIAARRGEL